MDKLTEALKDSNRVQQLIKENERMQAKVKENLEKIQAYQAKHIKPVMIVCEELEQPK